VQMEERPTDPNRRSRCGELFLQTADHDAVPLVEVSKETKYAVTKAFWEALFLHQNSARSLRLFSVEQEKVRWFYEMLIPVKFRQRRQDWGKIRVTVLNELINKAQQVHSFGAALLPGLGAQQHEPSQVALSPRTAKGTVEQQTILYGTKGPCLPVQDLQQPAWSALQKLINKAELRMTTRDVDNMWEQEKDTWRTKGRKRKREEEGMPVLLNILRMPVEKKIRYCFSLPGVVNPTFNYDRIQRTWAISGTVPSVEDADYIEQEFRVGITLTRSGELHKDVDLTHREEIMKTTKDGIVTITFPTYTGDSEVIML